MNIKKTMMSALLMLGFLSASAQEAKTVYDFNPHWYVQVQPLGAQYTLGEIKFKDLISYNAQLGIGYNFNPIVGARFSVNAWQSKAGMSYTNDFEWKWKYVAPQLDLTFNLSNLFCGYNPTRIFNFSVFGGFAANIGFDNDEAVDAKAQMVALTSLKNDHENLEYAWDETRCRIAGRFGAIADFRLSDAISLGLEANANALSDTYNSKRAGNADWYFNVLAGVKINLGKTYTARRVEAPKPIERIVERVVEKVVEKPVVEQPTPVVETVEALRRDIFFTINSTKIVAAEQQKVNDIVAYMNKYPASKVQVTGYADKGTGTAAINSRLAAQRAAVVVAALKKAGIAADRILSDSKGDTVQPFAENDKNRVSVCIAE